MKICYCHRKKKYKMRKHKYSIARENKRAGTKINDIVKELNSSTNSKTEQDDNNKKLKVKDAVAKEGEKS